MTAGEGSLQRGGAWRTAVLTAGALVAFAGNQLLCRAALRPGLIDAASFTAVRMGSGAAALWLFARLLSREQADGGSWRSALVLFAYAAPFSLAYLRLAAGMGALVNFGLVQTTMLGTGFLRGERASGRTIAGLAIAAGSLAALVWPGATAPDPLGVALMAVAGAAWGGYSLLGCGAIAPLQVTAGNFLRCAPLAAALPLVTLAGGGALHVTAAGLALGVACGVVTSGLGYTLWFAALPRHTRTRASLLQLLTPIIAAGGGVLFLAEPLTPRLIGWGLLVLAGIALALVR